MMTDSLVSSKLVEEARTFAENYLREQLPKCNVFHSITHTREVVAAATEIATNSGLNEEELEIVQLAAWFHDLGYCQQVEGHEEIGAQLAAEFLRERNYPQKHIQQVMGCIRATQVSQEPDNLLEEILCDADLAHLGGEAYFEKAELLRQEIENRSGEKITDRKWMGINESFLDLHEYRTPYAKEHYEKGKAKNLKQVKKRRKKLKKQKQLKDFSAEIAAKVEQRQKESDTEKPVIDIEPKRGIETMFRLTSKNHIDLSSMADNKANIMISINSIVLSVIVSVLLRKLGEYPHYLIPALLLSLTCLLTIVFAVLATRPNVSKGKFTPQDIEEKRTNLLFFGNFHGMKLEDYEWGMKEMMKDGDYLYSSLIRDIYFLGKVLGKKYRLLRITYTIFVVGFVISVTAFIIATLLYQQPSP